MQLHSVTVPPWPVWKKTLPAEYEVTIIPEEDGYLAARFPDFPGIIITGGRTPEGALSNAQEALAATLETMRARKIPLPTPKRKFSGQFNVRVSRSLYFTLVYTAAEEGVSLNALVSQLLQTALVNSSK